MSNSDIGSDGDNNDCPLAAVMVTLIVGTISAVVAVMIVVGDLTMMF